MTPIFKKACRYLTVCFILFIILPFALLSVAYICLDPFHVWKPYSNYSNFHVIANREYISTEKFLYNRSKHPYNSFIFGSSRTLAFRASTWKTFLNQNDQLYCFDASAENIYGIYSKIRFLDSLHQGISNAMVLLDRERAFAPSIDSLGHFYIRHPLLSGGSKFAFQCSFFKAYLQSRFLVSYYTYIWRNRYDSSMKNCITEQSIIYDSINNEIDLQEVEHKIKTDSAKFYSQAGKSLYDRKGESTDSIARIRGQYAAMLDTIHHIFERNGTNYKIIIGPAYDQVKFNKEDMDFLRQEFKDRLYDFSGKNYFTEQKSHYYDFNHYRPCVGDSILKIVYANK
jgi:hypothetical protein